MHPDGQQKIASIFGTPIMKIESGLQLLKEDIVICVGIGKTKKKAEQNASYNALVEFNVL